MKKAAFVILGLWVMLFAQLALSASGSEQETAQDGGLRGSYAGFEGRNVSSIEIAMAPGGDEQQIRSMLALKPGEPFAMEKLKASVAKIQESAKFDEIQASLEPDATGIRVVLLLQPVFHVGLISFPGAIGKFAYTTLLQTSQIQLDAVYSPDYLPARSAAIQSFLVKEGYFEAHVQSHTEADPRHRLVNVTFDCQLGKRARIGTIAIEGVPQEEAARLRATLNSLWAKVSTTSVKSGQVYSRKRIEKGIERVRAYYQKSGRLAPKVEFEPAYDASTNKAELRLRVTPGPTIEVKVEGAHVWSRTLRKLVPVFEEGAADQELINEGVRNLRSHFQSKSYFDAQVKAETEKDADRLTIIYHVDLGKKQRVNHVLFTNNKHFSDPELRDRIAIGKAPLPLTHGKYSDALLKQSVTSLIAVYHNEGFASVKVVPLVTKAAQGVDVEFVITEGPQDTVRSLAILDSRGSVALDEFAKDSRGGIASEGFAKRLKLLPGKPYSQHYLDEDRSHVLAYYFNHGYPNATFESAATSPAPEGTHEFVVTYHVNEGQFVRVKEAVLLGAEHTNSEFLGKIVGENVRPEQPLDQQKVFESESDLYSLGVFDWASVMPVDFGQGAAEEPVLIRVHESKRNSLDLGGGLEVIPRDGNVPVGAVAVPGLPPVSLGNKFTVSQKSFIGPRVSVQYARHDLRGRAETAAIGFVISRLDQRGSFTYADPHLHSSRWSSLFSVTAERSTENPIFAAATGQASFQIERHLDKKKTQRLVARYSYQWTDLTNLLIPELVLPQDRKVKLSTPWIEYLRDTRDKPTDAHRGQFESVSFGISPRAFGSSASFTRFLAQASFYRPVAPKLVWANNFRLGFAAPFNGSDVPLSERFFTGGPDSLRGFPINGAGPQRPVQVCSNPSDASTCTVISVPVGGKMLAIVNSEMRFPLPIYKDLGGAVFYDGGNVYSNVTARQFINNYSSSIGVGLRYYTKVGPIRIDVGRNLNPIPGVKATQYFITLGQAF